MPARWRRCSTPPGPGGRPPRWAPARTRRLTRTVRARRNPGLPLRAGNTPGRQARRPGGRACTDAGGRRCGSVPETDGDGGVGLEHPEVQALFEVETHDIGIVIEIADGEVLPALDLEVTAAQTEHDPAVAAGRPHQGTAEDLA